MGVFLFNLNIFRGLCVLLKRGAPGSWFLLQS